MEKTKEQIQAELDREIAYTRKVNDKNALLMEQVKDLKKQLENSISKTEHEKTLDKLRQEYERKLSEMESRPPRVHNERGAGRKPIASTEVMARVMELRGQGLSYAKIAVKLSEESGNKIGRTTVWEIVRGEYTPSDAE